VQLAEAAPATTIALIGNPNTGKTTLFNALTGLSHRVGNYPGVTVESKSGAMRLTDQKVVLYDLPGTYSLAARSPDELIAVDVLLGQQAGIPRADAVIAILDASNLQRNLYLLSQLIELEVPVVVALNMADVARRRGIEIDCECLSQRMGVPVIPTAADRGEGIPQLRAAVSEAIGRGAPRPEHRPAFSAALQRHVDVLHEELLRHRARIGRDVSRAEAFRALVDQDGEFERRFAKQLGETFVKRLESIREGFEEQRSLPSLEAHARYVWIARIVEGCVSPPSQTKRSLTDRIDAVVTHRLFGTVTLVLVLGAVFQAIYAWSVPLMDLIEGMFAGAAALVTHVVPEGALQSLLVDGVIGGVGGIMVFLPQILVLFLFLSLLEDCGYMSRAAFLMDKLLVRLGLSGKSVIPLLSSFACAVPGIMAARTIDSRKNRIATIVVAPLMSCSARLPVYVLLIGAFVPERSYLGGWVGLQGLTLFGAHLIGLLVAVPVLFVLKHTFFRGPAAPFVMELPPYRWPVWRNVVARLWEQTRHFVVRAGTIILAVSVVIWALSYFPRPDEIHQRYEARRAAAATEQARAELEGEEAGAYLRQSFLGRAGQVVEPVVEPLGWDWRIGMAVIGSFAAREVVIATMGTIFNVGDAEADSARLVERLNRSSWPDGRPLFTLPVALSLIVFFALCCQCASTLAIIRRETASWLWTGFTFAYMTLLAYAGGLIVYQATTWMGW
jgi:ferrous iron transport protein B